MAEGSLGAGIPAPGFRAATLLLAVFPLRCVPAVGRGFTQRGVALLFK